MIKLTICALILAITLFSGCASTKITPLSLGKGLEHCSFTRHGLEWDEVEFLRYVPSDYEAKPERKYPLVLFLHGSPPAEHTLADIAKNEIVAHVVKNEDFILIAPRSPKGKGWPVKLIGALLDETDKMLRVDTDRIYVTGFSMGGFATWKMAYEYPERFAALMPVCGRGDENNLYKIIHLPVWALHGEKDNVVPLTGSVIMVDTIKLIGGDARLTVFPGVGHASWAQAYSRSDVYEWLLSQKRKAHTHTPFAERYCTLKNAMEVKCETRYCSEATFSDTTFNLEVKNSSSDVAGTFSADVQGSDTISIAPSLINLSLRPGEVKAVKLNVKAAKPTAVAGLAPFSMTWKTSWQPQGTDAISYQPRNLPLVIAQFHYCPKTETAITVDGDVGEWKSLPYSIPMENGSARFGIAYDDKFLYVAVKVTDSELMLDPEKMPWQQDGIEVRLDARPDPERTISSKYREFRTIFLAALSPAKDGESRPVYCNEEEMPEGTKSVIAKTSDGYALEVAVPVSYLDEMQKAPWEMFRLNVAVNDLDSKGEKKQYWWNPDWRLPGQTPASGTFSRK